jgi:hypothetical protein
MSAPKPLMSPLWISSAAFKVLEFSRDTKSARLYTFPESFFLYASIIASGALAKN